MVESVKEKITTRAEYNFVPGYIMDAKYDQRELDKQEIAEAKTETAQAKAETEKLKEENARLKAELEALKK